MKKLVAAFLIIPATAMSAMNVDPGDTSVSPGVWCGNFAAATNYATRCDIPLVLVWGVTTTKFGECEHCAALTAELKTPEGLSWAAEQSAVFCFVEGFDWNDVGPNAGSGAKDFAKTAGGTMTALSTTPYVCLYWPRRAATRFTGVLNSMYSREGSSLLGQFRNSYSKFVSEVDVSPSHCAFPFGDTENDRLEVIVGETRRIDVPVVRTNQTDVAAACTVTFSCDGASSATNISWTVGESMAFARFALPDAFSASSTIYVTLSDASAAELARRTVHPLAEVENSERNPHWLGERTSDTLGWGEWTMDLDIVTNKVAAWNAANPSQKAYALALVEGCCWCPDCAMAEKNIFDNAAFKAWAAANRVVFGVVDIPSNPQAEGAYPSLLRYETYMTRDNFVTLRSTVAADESLRFQSGAGYLSRHSVAYGDAQEVYERNKALMGSDTMHGGWNRPENANKNRTGVPVFLLLRGDGTIAARWNRFSDVGPTAFSVGYLRRFEEMFAMADDGDEESDDSRLSTSRTVSIGDSLSGTVSTVDQADIYRIDAGENMLVSFAVSGGDAGLSAAILDESGTPIASASGVASAGFSVSARLGTQRAYLRISPTTIADGTFFGYTNEASTVCSYAVSASGAASGGEIGFSVPSAYVAEGSTNMMSVGVVRSAGSAGAASVKVVMTDNGAGSRISFQEQTLTWARGESGEKFVYVAIGDDFVPQETSTVVFGLSDLAAESDNAALSDGASRFTVTILDDDVSGTLLDRNVAYSESMDIDGWQIGDSVSIRKISGSLPAGLSVSCAGGTVTVAGVPRRAGVFAVSFVVSVLRNGAVVASQTQAYEFTVRDFSFSDVVPSLSSTRTYGNLPVVGGDGRVKGMLNITIPESGRMSARYWSASASCSYSASGWSAYDSAAGTLTAILTPSRSSFSQMTVTLDAQGGLVEFDDPSDGAPAEVAIRYGTWGASHPATAYAGQYTVQMPQTNVVDDVDAARLSGAAFMAMRMVTESAVANGVMLFAGMLPNGRPFSGTATLAEDVDGGCAIMSFFCRRGDAVAPYAFSGALSIDANAAESVPWTVYAAATPCWVTSEAHVHSSDFDVYGGYYDAGSVQSDFDADFSGVESSFGLMFGSASLQSSRYGAGAATDGVSLVMEGGSPSIDPKDANAQSASIRFSAWTGVVSGETYIPFADGGRLAVTYRGIALPGWQGCDTCAEGFVERPWALGSFSFSDRDSSGSHRNGGAVELGKMW